MVKPSETLPENVNDPASGLMVIDVQRERWGEREQNKGDFVTFAVVETGQSFVPKWFHESADVVLFTGTVE